MTDTPEERFVIEAVLFDLDGTLVDTIALITASMRYATRTVLGREHTDAELLRGVGTPLAYQMEELSPERAPELVRAYRDYQRETHDELIAEYPGVEEMLDAVAARGLPMGVVTSKARTVAERGIDLFGLRDRFSVIVCAEDTEIHKPEPEPLLHAARQLGVDPTACVYVGDSPYDMRAAMAAGVVAVAALWGAFCADDVLAPGPEFAIDEPADLDGWIEGDRDRFRVGSGAVSGSAIPPDSIDRASGTL